MPRSNDDDGLPELIAELVICQLSECLECAEEAMREVLDELPTLHGDIRHQAEQMLSELAAWTVDTRKVVAMIRQYDKRLH